MFERIDPKKAFVWIAIAFLAYILITSAGSEQILDKLLILPGLILALTIHEFSHAKMADKLGDPTPGAQGRLTFNPLEHMDIAGTICLFVAGFGWGKPVQVNPTYFRNPARDNMLVALAGPLSNMILAFILFFLYGILYYFLPLDQIWGKILIIMIQSGAYINLTLGLFNLLPVPPLDGSKILPYFLPSKGKSFIWALEKYSFIIIAILFFTELPRIIIWPATNWIANGMQNIVSIIIGPFI